MFPTKGLFKTIPCPNPAGCPLPNCLFSHDPAVLTPTATAVSAISGVGDQKRRKLADGHKHPASNTVPDQPTPSAESKPFVGALTPNVSTPLQHANKPTTLETNSRNDRQQVSAPVSMAATTVKTAQRPVSPPSRNSRPTPKPTAPANVANKVEALNPRLLKTGHNPASHALRRACLIKLHENLVKLNWAGKQALQQQHSSSVVSQPQNGHGRGRMKVTGAANDPADTPTSDHEHDPSNIYVATASELVRLALDEEERVARENPSVYVNVIKHRIHALSKMDPAVWRRSARPPPPSTTPTTISSTTASAASDTHKPSSDARPAPPPSTTTIDTGLPPHLERHMLTRFLARLDDPPTTPPHGYITRPPSATAIAQATDGLAAAAGWERCDRCTARFRVFPERRADDGALTSGGRCVYHWGRSGKRERGGGGDARIGRRGGGAAESGWTCCGTPLGAAGDAGRGCVEGDCHVFKVVDPKRLAAVMGFVRAEDEWSERTGERGAGSSQRVKEDDDDPNRPYAIALDCEMCHTVHGLELVRLTATSWPSGAPLIDALVRPLGAVLDLNTRFSGVSPSTYLNAAPLDADAVTSFAPPYDPAPPTTNRDDDSGHGGGRGAATSPLRILPSPHAARALLLRVLSPTTPLIGHALENDLAVLRLCHPAVVDTAFLFPHPAGLPIRRRLRDLAARYLGWEIQGKTVAGKPSTALGVEKDVKGAHQEGAKEDAVQVVGHDSLEDARAAGELVKWLMREEWRRLQTLGWGVDAKGQFTAPAEEAVEVTREGRVELPPFYGAEAGAGSRWKRRKRKSGADDENGDREDGEPREG